MALCAYCYGPAHALLTVGGAQPRAITTCPTHHPQAHKWARTAGPVHETHLTATEPAPTAPTAHPTLF